MPRGVLALTDQLISLTVAPCSFAAKTTDHFFSHYKKRGGGVGLQSWFKVFFPIYFPLDGRPAYNLAYQKEPHLSGRRLASEPKTNSGAGGHTGRGLLTSLASSETLAHFMICSFSEWRTVSPSAAQKKTPVWVCLIPARGSALGTLLGPF